MDESKTYAWILLSVTTQPTSLHRIIATADAINHAIPTQEELNVSLGWLAHRGLIRKDGELYRLTETGGELTQRVAAKWATRREEWNALAEMLSALIGAGAPPDTLTEGQVEKACKAYNKEFWQAYRKAKEADR